MRDIGECSECKCPVWIPDTLYEAARCSPNINFYCAYGHRMHYPRGEPETEKLRRERDRLKQQMAQKDDEIREQREMRAATERQLSAQRGAVTRIKNRVCHGVCPCCTRTFGNLTRHMESKHPEYAKSDVILAAQA